MKHLTLNPTKIHPIRLRIQHLKITPRVRCFITVKHNPSYGDSKNSFFHIAKVICMNVTILPDQRTMPDFNA